MKNAPVTIYNQDLELVAYLENATGIAYKKRKGEVWSASFCLPADDPKNAECLDFRYAEIFDGDKRVELFRIVLNGKSRIKGKPVIKYECKHALCTLNDDTMVGEHNAGPGVTAALEYILGKQVVTHWQLGTQEFTQSFYHYWKDLSLLAALYTVPERFRTAHRWTFDTTSHPWTLNLLEAPTTVSARIAYKKNMQQVDRKSRVDKLYTRLYPYGYGAGAAQVDISTIDLAAKGRPGFTSGSVEFTVGEVLTGALSSATAKVKAYYKVKGAWSGTAEGVVFLTDVTGTFTDGEDLNGSESGDNCATLDSSLECVYAEAVTKYGVITRKWEDQRYTDPENLYAAAEEKVDANAVPELTYTIKAADLYRLTKRGEFILGDLVKVYDGPLAIDVDARVVELSKKDVEGKPGDIGIQLGNKVEKFPDFGGIVYADDLDQVKDGTKWARVLSTQILAGKILLSAVPGGTVGALPATPTLAGLYVGATHFGFHGGEGSDWIAYIDNAARLRCVAENAHLYFDPADGGTLDIKSANVEIEGTMTITAGEVGGFNVDPVEGLYIGTGVTRVQMKPGVGMWCGATAFDDAPWRVSPAGAVVCTNLTVEGGSWGGDTLAVAKIPSLDCDKIVSGTFGAVRIPSLDCDKITSGVFGAVRIPELSCSKITSGTFDAVRIPSLDCDKIVSGTFDAVRIPNLSCSKITSGTFDPVLIPTLTGDKISLTSYLAINDITYGSDGIQFQYNAGNPRAYIGNGTDAYFQFDGTKIQWKAANTELDANGNLWVSNLSVGAGSAWAGNVFGTAYIPNLSCSKITSGTFDPVRIPNLSADKITTGTLTGRKVQTAASGHRCVMLDTSYVLDCYKSGEGYPFFYVDAANAQVVVQTVSAQATLSAARIVAGGGSPQSGYELTVNGETYVTGKIQASGNLVLDGTLIVMNDPVTINTTTRDGSAYLTINGGLAMNVSLLHGETGSNDYAPLYVNGVIRKVRLYD